MGRRKEKEVVRHMTLEELNDRIKRGENTVRRLERLYFIRFLYKGDSIKQACERVNISEPTGYSWLKSWNESVIEGITPHFSGGPKPKLSEADLKELRRILDTKEAWTLREVRILIKEKFGIEFSEMHVWRILNSMNLRHAKPYLFDKKRPDDAEDILKKD